MHLLLQDAFFQATLLEPLEGILENAPIRNSIIVLGVYNDSDTWKGVITWVP